jgi:hypothetical protein
MLFSRSSLQNAEDRRQCNERRELSRQVFLDFAEAFPKIEFELQVESRTINAQAIVHGEKRIVRLYGGLAFHPLIGSDGLSLALLHEVGHHFSSGGRLAFGDDLGCECAADRWLLTKGVAALKRVGRSFSIEKAIGSLDALNTVTSPAKTLDSKFENNLPICWAVDWRKRKLYLSGLTKIPVVRRCYLSDFFASQLIHT